MGNTLNFSTGEQVFTVNDNAEIRFNPMSADFVQRFMTSVDAIEKIRDGYKDKYTNDLAPAEVFAISNESNKDIRAEIDAVFGEGISNAIFGGMNVNSIADGLPVWLNFYFAVIDVIENKAANVDVSTAARMSAYKKRYGKYMKK